MTDDISVSSAYADSDAGRRAKAHRAWRSAESIKRISDRLIGIGPIGLGLDGVLAWVPGAGLVYGLGAGGLLMFHAVQGRASAGTLLRMSAYLAIDNVSDTVPGLGWAIDTLFPGHLMAAKALQKDIEGRHGLPEEIAFERSQKRRGLFGRKKG